MGTGQLHIDLDAIAANWRILDRMTAVETAAVVKADAYGLGAGPIATRLATEGARSFFTANAEEGAALREQLGPGPAIYVFSGHMAGDAALIAGAGLIPILASPAQVERHHADPPGHGYSVQIDTGMNRLGLEPADWAALRGKIEAGPLKLVISHLSSSDTAEAPQNAAQLSLFSAMTEGLSAPRSLVATGGVLLGKAYHFDLCRPGVGLYGGAPFEAAEPVVRLSLPVVQIRNVAPGETVGYSASWTAKRPSKIATLAGGYADGLTRHFSNRAQVFAGATPCPVVGRVSMDLIGVDVSDLDKVPEAFDMLGPQQGIDALARAADTIGYEILTSLGRRYTRIYHGGAA